jgi:4-aminobutyrate aminotransferase-like enzyme
MSKTITKSQILFERRKNAVANGVGFFNTATVQSAKGALIIDVDGNELIDFEKKHNKTKKKLKNIKRQKKTKKYNL